MGEGDHGISMASELVLTVHVGAGLAALLVEDGFLGPVRPRAGPLLQLLSHLPPGCQNKQENLHGYTITRYETAESALNTQLQLVSDWLISVVR